MFYNYVDIGTCNFKTSLDILKANEKIILVDPIKEYLDDLPSSINIVKENCAIDEINSTKKITYINPQLIKNKKFKSWVGGSSKIGEKHPLILKLLRENKITESDLITVDVNTLTFGSLVKKYDISSIFQLKIDTEGHEHIILTDVLEYVKNTVKIDRIIFEYREEFGHVNKLDKLIVEFTKLDYIVSWATKKQRDIQLEKL